MEFIINSDINHSILITLKWTLHVLGLCSSVDLVHVCELIQIILKRICDVQVSIEFWEVTSLADLFELVVHAASIKNMRLHHIFCKLPRK